MTDIFIVWKDGYNHELDSAELFAEDANAAAEKYADILCSDDGSLLKDEDMYVWVKKKGQVAEKYHVAIIFEPSFVSTPCEKEQTNEPRD
jgi:hypothetical protein